MRRCADASDFPLQALLNARRSLRRGQLNLTSVERAPPVPRTSSTRAARRRSSFSAAAGNQRCRATNRAAFGCRTTSRQRIRWRQCSYVRIRSTVLLFPRTTTIVQSKAVTLLNLLTNSKASGSLSGARGAQINRRGRTSCPSRSPAGWCSSHRQSSSQPSASVLPGPERRPPCGRS